MLKMKVSPAPPSSVGLNIRRFGAPGSLPPLQRAHSSTTLLTAINPFYKKTHFSESIEDIIILYLRFHRIFEEFLEYQN